MGKASRRKQLEISESTRQGITWAAEMIRDPRVLGTFEVIERLGNWRKDEESTALMTQMGTVAEIVGEAELAESMKHAQWRSALAAKEVRDVTPADWATGMTSAFRHAKFVDLLGHTVAVGHKAFWSTSPAEALQFGQNGPAPDDDPRKLAMDRAHRKLLSDPAGPGWTTLALFCLARMIAVNSSRMYHADEWSDATFHVFALEREFLMGDGGATAKLLVELDTKYFSRQLADIVGSRMMHGLAEASINAFDLAFFS
jgi:hypothetical protein